MMDDGITDGRRMKLIYLLGSFRPSERAELFAATQNTPALFLDALTTFLGKWAESSWIEEYNVERVGEWIAAKCSLAIRNGALQMAQGELAKSGHGAVHAKTYQALITGMTD